MENYNYIDMDRTQIKGEANLKLLSKVLDHPRLPEQLKWSLA